MSLDSTRAILADLIHFPTVSADGNLELIAYAQSRLDALSARTYMTISPCGTKANLFASIGPRTEGGVILSGHTDVVPVADQDWEFEPFQATEWDGKIYGRGACDMKGFIACALAMAPRFADTELTKPVHFAFTYDEEVGCLGAPQMLDQVADLGLAPEVCIIGEPTMMRLVEGHKGMCEYTTRFTGLAGHGSDPDRGVSAVEYAVRYVTRLLSLREELKARAPESSPFEPPWTTLQVGAIHGGSSHNVIAEHCEVAWELRPVVPEDRPYVRGEMDAFVGKELLPAMRAVHPWADVVTEVIGEVADLEVMPESEAAELVRALTGQEGGETVAFGTEAGIFQDHGISTVVCGPGSIQQAHKPDEYIALSQLDECLRMLEGLGRRLAA
jgi:acetylornithine deacetylase